MNRLQDLDEPVDYLVTLNADRPDRPGTVLRRMVYEHPVYTPASVAAQRRLPGLNTGRTAFAGAYHGWGFHEDGCASGRAGRRGVRGRLVTACRSAGRRPAAGRTRRRWRRRRSTTCASRTPAATRCATPSSTAATCGWSTSTTSPPAGWSRAGRCPAGCESQARFEAADHLGDPAASIKDNVVALAREHGVDDVHRVLMLASARSGAGRASYVFNPLSTHWCYRADGSLACLVAEVHNTYGERHAYLLRPDDAGPGGGGQGVLRLAVLRGRRPLPDAVLGPRARGCRSPWRCGRTARRRSPPASAAPPGRPPCAPSWRATAPVPDDVPPGQRADPAARSESCGCADCPSSLVPPHAEREPVVTTVQRPRARRADPLPRAAARRGALAGSGHPAARAGARPRRRGRSSAARWRRCRSGSSSPTAGCSAPAARTPR